MCISLSLFDCSKTYSIKFLILAFFKHKVQEYLQSVSRTFHPVVIFNKV